MRNLRRPACHLSRSGAGIPVVPRGDLHQGGKAHGGPTLSSSTVHIRLDPGARMASVVAHPGHRMAIHASGGALHHFWPISPPYDAKMMSPKTDH